MFKVIATLGVTAGVTATALTGAWAQDAAMPFSPFVGLPPAMVSPPGLPAEVAAQAAARFYPLPRGLSPGTGALTQPGTGALTQPGTGALSQPGTGAPIQPGTGAPGQPGTGAPSQPEPQVAAPPAQPKPAPGSAEAASCIDGLGPANAGVAANAAQAEAADAALARFADACAQAVEAGQDDPLVLFHASSVAQAEGRFDDARALLEQAADQGLPAAHTRLGDYHLFGVGSLRRDADMAVPHYQNAAEQGEPAAQLTLGILHRVGQGVDKDPARMVLLIGASAASGYHLAQLRMGEIYLTGEGIPGGTDADLGIPDPERALTYLERAATAGNAEARLQLAELTAPGAALDDPARHLRLIREAASQGMPEAHARLALIYEEGRGVPADPERAAAAFVKALEAGVPFGELRRGASGWGWDPATARAFQTILQERDLYQGAIDGQIGPMSRRAAEALRP